MLSIKFWHTPYPSLIWLFLILIGSPTPSSGQYTTGLSDKWVHFIFYAIFSFFLFGSTFTFLEEFRSKFYRSISVIAMGSFIGILIEFVQHFFIPSRAGDCLDVFANSFGLFGGLFLVLINKEIDIF